MKALIFIGMALVSSAISNNVASASVNVFGNTESVYNLPATAEDRARSFVNRHYPGAPVLDRDTDDGLMELKIRHKGIEKMVLFNMQENWLRTVWEIRRNQLPKRVLNALARQGFLYERVDDNDNMVMENPEGLFYAVQVERGNEDYILVVSSAGRILHRFYDDEWDDGRWDRTIDIYDDWDDRYPRRGNRHYDRDDWDDDCPHCGCHDWDDDDRFDEGDDEWDDRYPRRGNRYYDRDDDDGEDHFDEGDDEWDDGPDED